MQSIKTCVGVLLILLGITPGIVSTSVEEGYKHLISNRHAFNTADIKSMPINESIFVNYGLFAIWLGDRIEGKRKFSSINRERRKAKRYFYKAEQSSQMQQIN